MEILRRIIGSSDMLDLFVQGIGMVGGEVLNIAELDFDCFEIMYSVAPEVAHTSGVLPWEVSVESVAHKS